MKKFKVSVVVPSFNEAESIPELIKRLLAVLKNYSDYEIIFVDDGSQDDTLTLLNRFHKKNKKINYISFARNFGHQYALRAGLSRATGDCVISMDADLQHPPELLPEMIEKWLNGADIVYTVRKNTQGVSFFKKLSSRLFYRFFNFLTGVNLPAGTADFRLLDKKAVTVLNQYQERSLFLRGVVAELGFHQEAISYEAHKRFAGTSAYTFKKMLSLAVSGATSFGVKPLRLAIWLGLITACMGACFSAYVLWARFFGSGTISGWASMMCVILILGGAQLFIMGIMGEYIGLIFLETKNRPRYIVRSTTFDDK